MSDLERINPWGELERLAGYWRPDPKPAKRIVATRSQWSDLRFEKLGRCRIPGCEEYDTELHHVVSRSLGGPDEAANLVPLCRRHHTLVELWHRPTLTALRESFRPEEIRSVLDLKGADYLERRYPA